MEIPMRGAKLSESVPRMEPHESAPPSLTVKWHCGTLQPRNHYYDQYNSAAHTASIICTCVDDMRTYFHSDCQNAQKRTGDVAACEKEVPPL